MAVPVGLIRRAAKDDVRGLWKKCSRFSFGLLEAIHTCDFEVKSSQVVMNWRLDFPGSCRLGLRE